MVTPVGRLPPRLIRHEHPPTNWGWLSNGRCVQVPNPGIPNNKGYNRVCGVGRWCGVMVGNNNSQTVTGTHCR